MDRVELGCELPGPVAQDVAHRHGVGDGERQVEIRPAIAAAVRKSPDGGGSDHARINRCHLQHAITHAVTVVDTEHERMLADDGRRSDEFRRFQRSSFHG